MLGKGAYSSQSSQSNINTYNGYPEEQQHLLQKIITVNIFESVKFENSTQGDINLGTCIPLQCLQLEIPAKSLQGDQENKNTRK